MRLPDIGDRSPIAVTGPPPAGRRLRPARLRRLAAGLLLVLAAVTGAVVPSSAAQAVTPQELFAGTYRFLDTVGTVMPGWTASVEGGKTVYTHVPAGQECAQKYPAMQNTTYVPDRELGYFHWTTIVQHNNCPDGEPLPGRNVRLFGVGNEIHLFVAEWPYLHYSRDLAAPASDCGVTWEQVISTVNDYYRAGLPEGDIQMILDQPGVLCAGEARTESEGSALTGGTVEDKGEYKCQVLRTPEDASPRVGTRWLNTNVPIMHWRIQQDVCFGKNEVFSAAGPKNAPNPAYFVNIARDDNWFTRSHNCTTGSDAGTVVSSGWTDTSRQSFYTTRSITVNCPSRFGLSFSFAGKGSGIGISVNLDGSMTVTTTTYVTNQGDGTVQTRWMWGPRNP